MTSVEDPWDWISPYLRWLKAQSDRDWDLLRREFLTGLGLVDPEQHPVVHAFISHVDNLSTSERTAFLRTDEPGNLLRRLIQQRQPAVTGHNEAAFAEFLTVKGPNWDGTEETWLQFRPWFLSEATAMGVGDPALALVLHLDGLPVSGRITAFGDLGVVINAPAPTATETVTRPEPVIVPDEEPVEVAVQPPVETAKRKREEPPREHAGQAEGDAGAVEEPPRKSRRLSAKAEQAEAAAVTLTVVTTSAGPKTQRRDVEQAIGFDMDVTLTTPPGTQSLIKASYELRQYVRDAYVRTGDTHELDAEFELDGPFQPNYTNENIVVNRSSILFRDHPGFSTKSKIAAGHWLTSYRIEFYWRVTRKLDSAVWRSPTVFHTVASKDAPDKNTAPITYTPSAAATWNVNFR